MNNSDDKTRAPNAVMSGILTFIYSDTIFIRQPTPCPCLSNSRHPCTVCDIGHLLAFTCCLQSGYFLRFDKTPPKLHKLQSNVFTGT